MLHIIHTQAEWLNFQLEWINIKQMILFLKFWKFCNLIKEYCLSSGLWNYKYYNNARRISVTITPAAAYLQASMQICIDKILYFEFTSLKCQPRIPSDSIWNTIFFQTVILTFFLVVYFSHIQNCIQLVITHLTSCKWTRRPELENSRVSHETCKKPCIKTNIR